MKICMCMRTKLWQKDHFYLMLMVSSSQIQYASKLCTEKHRTICLAKKMGLFGEDKLVTSRNVIVRNVSERLFRHHRKKSVQNQSFILLLLKAPPSHLPTKVLCIQPYVKLSVCKTLTDYLGLMTPPPIQLVTARV